MTIKARFLTAYAWLYVVASMGALAVIVNSPVDSASGDISEPSRAFVLCWVGLYLATLACIPLVRWRFNKGDLIVLSIGLYFLLGTIWSHIPANTIRYATSLMMNIVAAMVLARIMNYEAFPKFIARTIVSIMFISMLLMSVGYDNVMWIDPHSRSTIFGTEPMRGLFFHKIPAGIYAAVGFWLCLLLFKGWRRIAGAGACLIFDGLTGSSIGLALVPLIGLLLGVAYVAKSAHLSLAAFFSIYGIVLVSGVAAFFLVGPDVLALLDRDPTLTGRTLLWSWGLETALERPVLGWGFFGYFGSDEAAAAARQILAFRNYDVPHFHSSYIQLLAEAGIVPAILIIAVLFYTLGRSYQAYLRGGGVQSLAYYTIIASLLFVGGFSLVFIRYNDISTSLLFIMVCYTYRVAGKASRPRSLRKPAIRPLVVDAGQGADTAA